MTFALWEIITWVISGLILTGGGVWMLVDEFRRNPTTLGDLLVYFVGLLFCWIPVINTAVALIAVGASIGEFWNEKCAPTWRKLMRKELFGPLGSTKGSSQVKSA